MINLGKSFVYRPAGGFASTKINIERFNDLESAKRFSRHLVVPENFWFSYLYSLHGYIWPNKNTDIFGQYSVYVGL